MISFTYKFIPLLLLASFFSVNKAPSGNSNLKNGNAIIKGQVTIQERTTQRRVYRGRAYRGGSSQESTDDSQKTPYQNTIISAHPISYELDADPLPEPVQIEQENATFLPHITPVTVGSTVEFVNSDPFYHNVFSLTPGAKFNIGRRRTGTVVSQTVPRLTGEVEVEGLGEIELFCDIHSQMNAKVLSLNTPYYIRVNEDGSFKLTGIPAGRYELRAYNPNYDNLSVELTVEDGEELQQDFNFSG